MIRILHISDIHAQPAKRTDLSIVGSALLRSVEAAAAKAPIDLVCCSGDIAFSGRDEEYLLAAEVILDPLLATLGLSKDRLSLVPGNHDVERKLIIHAEEQSLRQELRSLGAVNELLDDGPRRQSAANRLTTYASFTAAYLGRSRPNGDALLADSHSVAIDGVTVGIAQLNTAWRCSGNTDQGLLLLGDRQVDWALTQIRNAGLRIALLHHPLSWLADFDELNSRKLLLRDVDLVLSGHLHHPDPTVTIAPAGRCLFSSAGAVFEGRTLNGFSIVEYDPHTATGQVILFRYFDDRREYLPDIITADGGSFPFSIAAGMVAHAGDRRASDRRAAASEIPPSTSQVFRSLTMRLGRQRGVAWTAGVAIGITRLCPGDPARQDGKAVDLVALAARNRVVAGWHRDIETVSERLASGEEGAAQEITGLAARACRIWGAQSELRRIDLLDGVCMAIMATPEDYSSTHQDHNSVADLQDLLSEQRYEEVLEKGVAVAPSLPAIRRIVVAAYAATQQYAEIVALLESVEPTGLDLGELQNFLWAIGEQGAYSRLGEHWKLHLSNYAPSAQLFRRAFLERFPKAGAWVVDRRDVEAV